MYMIYCLVVLFVFVVSMFGCDYLYCSFIQCSIVNGVDVFDSYVEVFVG